METPALQKAANKHWYFFSISIFLSLCSLLADFTSPQGYTEWIFYLIPLLVISFINHIKFVTFIAIVNSFLILAGYFLSEDPRSGIVIFHRILGLFMIWVLYVNILNRARTQSRLKLNEIELSRVNNDLVKRNSELAAEKQRWKQVVQGIADEVWVCDIDGKISFVNLPDVKSLGVNEFKRKEVLGQEKIKILNPDETTRTKEQDPLLKALRGEIVRGEEILIDISKASSKRWRIYSAAPIRDDNGDVIGSVSVVRDITEHKNTEENLRRSQYDLNRAQAVAQIGSWRMDLQTGELVWSDETYKIFNIDKNTSLTYDVFLSKVHFEDKSFVDQKWKSALHGEPYDIELRIIVDNSVKWVRAKAEFEHNEKKQMMGGFGTIQDITERKHVENALRESENRLKIVNEKLEETIIKRTEQVRSLSKALALSEQRERKRFSQLLHEDLQQVLFAANMQISYAFRDVEIEKWLRDEIDEAKKLIKKAVAITKNLALELNPPILPGENLQKALEWLLSHVKKDYNLNVNLQIEPVPEIAEDIQIMIIQLIRELLSNVIKHSGCNYAQVHITTTDENLVIEVSDEGKGFDVVLVKKTKTRVGYGLFGIDERLRMFNGRLELLSFPGKGTTVKLIIPIQIL